MDQSQEKDYFWFYIAGVVVAALITVTLVKSSEHGKYKDAVGWEKEDSSNSAYLKKQ